MPILVRCEDDKDGTMPEESSGMVMGSRSQLAQLAEHNDVHPKRLVCERWALMSE